jgi:hypothetical protein
MKVRFVFLQIWITWYWRLSFLKKTYLMFSGKITLDVRPLLPEDSLITQHMYVFNAIF